MTDATPPIRVGLLGLGKMGQNHLRVLSSLKGADLAFIYDADTQLAKNLADRHGLATGHELEALLPGADAVVICTPTSTHSEMLRAVAPGVRNIFMEKPLSHSLSSSEADLAFIGERGLNVQVGFIERFNPVVSQLKAMLERSDQVISVDFTRTNKLSARITDVDVITDLMIHDIDLALYLNGPVAKVSAQGLVENGMIALASVQFEHTNGRFSRLHASRVTEKKIRTIQATCSDMYVSCELVRKELLVDRQSEVSEQKSGLYKISAIQETIEIPQTEALAAELQAFVESCKNGQPASPSASCAHDAAIVCDQIQKAVLS